MKCADVSLSRLQSTEFSETPSPDSDSVNSLEGHSEPSWFKDIKFDDSDTEQQADDTDYTMPSVYLQLKHLVAEFSFSSAYLNPTTSSCLCPDSASPSKRTSVSSFQSVVDSDSAASINLNMEQNNVNFHIKKQSKYPHMPPTAEQKGKRRQTCLNGFVQFVCSSGHKMERRQLLCMNSWRTKDTL